MKKFLLIVSGFMVLSLLIVNQAHAFSLKDLMSQVRGNLGANAIGSMVTDDTSLTTGTKVPAPIVLAPTVVPVSFGTKESIQVLNLQAALQNVGIQVGSDGNFGSQTVKAVSTFQQANNLPVTGKVDTQTATVLNQKVTEPSTSSLIKSLNAKTNMDVDTFIKNIPNQIAQLQKILKDPSGFKTEVIRSTSTIGPREGLGGTNRSTTGGGSNHICINNAYGGSNEYYWINGMWYAWALWSEQNCSGTSNPYVVNP